MLSTKYVLGDSIIKYIGKDKDDVKVHFKPGATIKDMIMNLFNSKIWICSNKMLP